MSEKIYIQDDLILYRMNLREARQLSPVKEKRFVENKSLKNLIYHIFGTHTEINYNQYGKPHLVGHTGNISVTHNSEWLMVLYSNQKNIGVDVEEIKDRILHLQKKFLSEDEIPHHREDKIILTAAWCAKEAVLKCVGSKKASFQKHLKIQSISVPSAEMHIESFWPEKKGLFKVKWIVEHPHVIAYVVEPD